MADAIPATDTSAETQPSLAAAPNAGLALPCMSAYRGCMRAGATFVAMALVIGACSSAPSGNAADRASVPSSTATPPSSTATPPSSTVVTATTATTVTSVAEPTTPLFLDGRGERWSTAWHSDDFDAMAVFFAEDAIFNGRSFAKVRDEVGPLYVDPYGWDEFFEDCVHHSTEHVTCEAKWTSDLHRPAGVEVAVHREVFFDGGLITSFNDHEDFREVIEFHVAFHEWIATAHPEIDPLVYAWNEVAAAEQNIRAAIDLVDDFIAQSSEYPLNGPTIVAEPVLSGSIDGVEVFNATEVQVELVAWALDRFAAAGLAPPPVTHVTFPPTVACDQGFSGMSYHTNTDGHIDVCASSTQLSTRQDGRVPLAPRRTILHELGHLWTVAHLNADSRQAFLDMLGLEAWSGVGWESSASEMAAEILMWGIIDAPIEPRVPNTTCSDRTAAFVLLTGVEPTTEPCG